MHHIQDLYCKLAVLIEKGVLPLKVFLNTNRTKWAFQQKYDLFYLQNDMVTCMFFEYTIVTIGVAKAFVGIMLVVIAKSGKGSI